MTEAVALAFDPSPTGFTYAVLGSTLAHRGARPVIRLIGTGGFDQPKGFLDARAEIKRLLRDHQPTVFAVEAVAGYLAGARTARQKTNNWDISALIDTAKWGGFIAACAANPAAVLMLPANAAGRDPAAWRFQLTKKATAGDREVAKALDFWLDGGLAVRGRKADGSPIYRDNDHKRDAMGLGVVALLLSGELG